MIVDEEFNLTAKEKMFADYFLTEAKFNASAAARLAGYSVKTAHVIGFEILRKPKVLAYIREKQRLLEINEFKTLENLRDVAYSDWRDHVQVVYDSEGNVKECILQLRDKVKALELLAKIQGLTTEKIELTGKNGGPVQTELILPVLDDDDNGNTEPASM